MSRFANTREWRHGVYQETKHLSGNYPVTASIKLRFDAGFKFEKRFESMIVTITNEDTLVAGARLMESGHTPMMLNFANDRHPGGGVESGAAAQEESLFRRTNLHLTLLPTLYPTRDNEGIYTPAATVFRASEPDECKLLAKPWQGAFSTVPGIYRPNITAENKLDARDAARLDKKIRIILQMGAQHGHDTLVLGALGCGAWRNPPAHVAEIFRTVVSDYNGAFKEIVFAIYDCKGSSNFEEFAKVFSR
jgi:uncharacterized protein (TIGR02452 family)